MVIAIKEFTRKLMIRESAIVQRPLLIVTIGAPKLDGDDSSYPKRILANLFSCCLRKQQQVAMMA